MQAIELKFLLKLLGFPNYRAKITDDKLKPNKGTTAAERDRICRELSKRGILNYSREVGKFKIAPAGKNLLNANNAEIPLTDEHFKVLKACEKETITPGKVKSVAPERRQSVIQDLEAKGLIKVEKEVIKEVWLNDKGHEYLLEDYLPGGGDQPSISLNMLKNYLIFLRKFLRKAAPFSAEEPTTQIPSRVEEDTNSTPISDKPDDETILATIKSLDKQLNTGNYLPIFHLRQKLQPPLSRDELDQALYRLQRQNKIELSSLVESIRYTPEQIEAGIPQDAGGPLFFLVVNG